MSSKITNLETAYKVASHIDSKLNIGECATIAGERIEKHSDGMMYLPLRNTTQWTPSELAHFVIWPNRKAWNAALTN